MQVEIKEWLAIVNLAAPIVALLLSVTSLWISLRAHEVALRQEKRKEPKLFPELRESYFQKFDSGDRIYSFYLSVRNPRDSDNAIARIEMHLRYRVDGETAVTVKIQPAHAIEMASDGRPLLKVPCRVAAHDTVSGWCDFIVKAEILDGHEIEGYQIVLADSHQVVATVDVLVVSRKRHVV